MNSPVEVTLSGVTYRYPGTDTPALTGVDLALPAGTITALLGPSGGGKSTLLAVLAGLLRPTSGQVLVDGSDVAAVPPEQRRVGVVFQRPLLFPHLNVVDNIAFGLRRQGIRKTTARHRARELLELVDLVGLDTRRPDQLSGGQAQRVALARALVPNPRMLLLDEPLSALDPSLRDRMRELIHRIQRELHTTAVFVTHDRTEAVEIADQIALLLDGRIAQVGTASQLHLRPTSAAVAQFLGTPTLVPGRNDNGIFHGPLGPVPLPDGAPTGAVLLVIRENTALPRANGEITAVVTETRDLGTTVRIRARANETVDLVTSTPPGRAPAVDTPLRLHLPPEELWTIPTEDISQHDAVNHETHTDNITTIRRP